MEELKILTSEKDKKYDGETIIIGKETDRIYRTTFAMASKNGNGKVTLKARGKNILMALDVSKWAYRVMGYVVENVCLLYVEHNDGNGKAKTVNELKIIMKKRALACVVFVPIGLLLMGLGECMVPLVSSWFLTFLADIFVLR